MNSKVIINSDISSDKGYYRSENQDTALCFEYNDVCGFVICDGMGGHYHGSIASYVASKFIRDSLQKYSYIFKTGNESTIKKWYSQTLKKILKKMNNYGEFNSMYYDMGTTVLSVFYYNHNLYIFNVGDCRLYIRYKDEKITKQITIDQTLPNLDKETLKLYLDDYEINLNNAHNILYSALGPNKQLNIDYYSQKINKDVVLIMSSDGIHDYVTLNTINDIIANTNNIFDINKNLLNAAINNDSTDNMSSIVVNIEFVHD